MYIYICINQLDLRQYTNVTTSVKQVQQHQPPQPQPAPTQNSSDHQRQGIPRKLRYEWSLVLLVEGSNINTY